MAVEEDALFALRELGSEFLEDGYAGGELVDYEHVLYLLFLLSHP